MPELRSAEDEPDREVPPRQRLLIEVRRGALTPAGAEAEAARLGIRPLLDRPDPAVFDPMREDRWTLTMTIAWIVWRTPDAVRENWHAYVIGCEQWRGVFKSGVCVGFEPGPVPRPTLSLLALKEDYPRERTREAPWRPRSPHDALEELWKALEQGDIEADAIDNDTGKRIDIPALAWKSLDLYPELECDIVRESPLSRSGYEDIRFPVRQIVDAWPDRVLSETLPPLMSLEGPGYMPLSAAVQWITTRGGMLDVGHDPAAWDDAYRELIDRIASSEVAATGKEFRSGRSESLDSALFSDLEVHHLFSSEELDHADDDELYLWATPYVDREHWRAKFSDDLRQRRKTIWSKLVVSKADVVKWWPFEIAHEIDPGPPRTGAPGAPSTMSYIVAEHDKRCDDNVADNSVGREAKHLKAWFENAYKGWPCATAKTIENRIRERHRQWRNLPRN